MMTSQIATVGTSVATHPLRKVVVVSRNPGEDVPDSVMNGADYDVVVIESLAHAYSQIKRVSPNLVIMCLSFDDLEAFQVMSILQMDTDTARIPMMTYTGVHADALRDDSVDAEGGKVRQPVQVWMN
jgi:PleD family two-component response regulator